LSLNIAGNANNKEVILEIKDKNGKIIWPLYTLRLERELEKVVPGWVLYFSEKNKEFLLCRNTGSSSGVKYSDPENQWRWGSEEPFPGDEEIDPQVKEIIESEFAK